MALTADRAVPQTESRRFSDPVAAATILYAGALAALDASGNAVPASATVAQRTRGVVQLRADNSAGAAGDIRAEIWRGTYRLDNSAAADLITVADIGNPCYVVDDETVAKTDGTGTRPVAGVIRNVDSDGVWVEI
jgi:hypothetical protein